MAKPADLLRARIAESGLSVTEFAHEVMSRDDRTLRRWLAEDIEIPPRALDWLERAKIIATRRSVRMVVVRRSD